MFFVCFIFCIHVLDVFVNENIQCVRSVAVISMLLISSEFTTSLYLCCLHEHELHLLINAVIFFCNYHLKGKNSAQSEYGRRFLACSTVHGGLLDFSHC